MRRIIAIISIILILTGCSLEGSSSKLSDQYSVGDVVQLGDIKFYIYKINEHSNELYLMSDSCITSCVYSSVEFSGSQKNKYDGSYVQFIVNRFVDDLEDMGYAINDSGIIDFDDLYDLGFVHSDTLSGKPYLAEDVPGFIKSVSSFWVGGYCKYDSYSWVYQKGKLETQKCEDEYGVRPIIVINPSEIEKEAYTLDPNIKIKDVISSDSAWCSEGGFHNPYARYYFDLERMLLIEVFESPECSRTKEYSIEIVDDKKIAVYGFASGWPSAEITLVSENKLRLRYNSSNAGYRLSDNFFVRAEDTE